MPHWNSPGGAMGSASPPAPRKRYQPSPPRPVACQSPGSQGKIGELVAERASVIPYLALAPFVGVGMDHVQLDPVTGQLLEGLFSTERQALETVVYPPHGPGELLLESLPARRTVVVGGTAPQAVPRSTRSAQSTRLAVMAWRAI